ncbi:MAG: P-type conjugative transfer protein VirB9 [Neisseria sp.]|nr:P-type conjugative transfer protein VirB9 [Neisseria sp.]
MNMKSKVAATLIMAMMPAVAAAVAIPLGSSKDGRIQSVMYNPNDVVHVRARVGEAVLVQLEADERIDGETAVLGMGYADGWKVAVRGNNLVFKPAAASPATNLLITTNKNRTYAFELSLAAKKSGKRVQKTTYILRFIYPDTAEYKARIAAEKQARALKRLEQVGSIPHAKHNYEYWGYGHKSLAPTAAYDNGRFTYFSFNNGKELPLIYKVMEDGTEALLNTHIEEDTVVIHETAKKYILRLGKSVLGIENRGYNESGLFNRTGTSDKNLVRITAQKESK